MPRDRHAHRRGRVTDVGSQETKRTPGRMQCLGRWSTQRDAQVAREMDTVTSAERAASASHVGGASENVRRAEELALEVPVNRSVNTWRERGGKRGRGRKGETEERRREEEKEKDNKGRALCNGRRLRALRISGAPEIISRTTRKRSLNQALPGLIREVFQCHDWEHFSSYG